MNDGVLQVGLTHHRLTEVSLHKNSKGNTGRIVFWKKKRNNRKPDSLDFHTDSL